MSLSYFKLFSGFQLHLYKILIKVYKVMKESCSRCYHMLFRIPFMNGQLIPLMLTDFSCQFPFAFASTEESCLSQGDGPFSGVAFIQ